MFKSPTMNQRTVPLLGSDLVFLHESVKVLTVNTHQTTLPIELNIRELMACQQSPERPQTDVDISGSLCRCQIPPGEVKSGLLPPHSLVLVLLLVFRLNIHNIGLLGLLP
jgi:hypothetical protein